MHATLLLLALAFGSETPQLKLQIQADRASYPPGAPIQLEVKILNLSQYYVPLYEDLHAPGLVKVIAAGTGVVVTVDFLPLVDWQPRWVRGLRFGQSITKRSTLLDPPLARPGLYTLQLIYELSPEAVRENKLYWKGRKNRKYPAWTGRLVSNSIRIRLE